VSRVLLANLRDAVGRLFCAFRDSAEAPGGILAAIEGRRSWSGVGSPAFPL
jgi:hypothetical protein